MPAAPDPVAFSVLLPQDATGAAAPDIGEAADDTTPKVALPTIGVRVELVPGYPYPIVLSTEESIRQAFAFCYRMGADDLVARLYQAIPLPFADTRRVASKFITELRTEVTEALEDVTLQMESVFRETLDQARAVTRLSMFGFVDAPPAANRTPVLRDYDLFKTVRQAVVDLDKTARDMIAYNERLQSPPDAVYQAFDLAWQQATTNLPGLLDPGADLIAKTTRQYTADEMADFATGEGEYRNPLDMLIRNAMWANWRDVWTAGPKLSDEYLAAAEKARRESWVSALPPPFVHAELSPMWRLPTIVHSALYRLGAGPGSIEYAAATETIRLAAARDRFEDKMGAALVDKLNWAAMGFGVASMVPVIGPFALAATVACAAALAAYHHYRYEKAKLRRDAFGPLAAAYGFADPDGSGLLLAEYAAYGNLGLQAFGVLSGLAGKMLRLAAWQNETVGWNVWMQNSAEEYFVEVFDAEIQRANLLRSPLDPL